MLNYTMDELRQTRFYQEVSAEGREQGLEQGLEQGQRHLIMTLLQAKLGQLSARQQDRMQTMSADDLRSVEDHRLPSLGLALLNFTTPADLDDWLNA
jgi:predicted transposase YdaD